MAGNQRGVSLIETVIALAVLGLVIPLVLNGLATSSTGADHAYDRSVLLELAESQMEDIQRQPYQENAASYSLISAPSGYGISVAASVAQGYVYPAPLSTATQQTVQQVTVTVTGVRGNLSLQGYKVRR